MSGKWLERGACPECGSSDANVSHSEGYSHCFSCDTHFKEGTDQVVVPMQNIKEGFTVGELKGIENLLSRPDRLSPNEKRELEDRQKELENLIK